MRDEEAPQFFRVRIDVEAELREDREPDVFAAEGEMVVFAVCVSGRVNEAVGGAEDGVFGAELLEIVEGILQDRLILG